MAREFDPAVFFLEMLTPWISRRLTSIFGQLASFNNPDFLGMSGVLNEKKGSVSHPCHNCYQGVPFGLHDLSYGAIISKLSRRV